MMGLYRIDFWFKLSESCSLVQSCNYVLYLAKDDTYNLHHSAIFESILLFYKRQLFKYYFFQHGQQFRNLTLYFKIGLWRLAV